MKELHEAIVLGFMLGSIGRKASSEIGKGCRKFVPHEDGEALSEDWIISEIAREFKQASDEADCISGYAHHSYTLDVIIHYPPSWECPSVVRTYCPSCGHYLTELYEEGDEKYIDASRIIHLQEAEKDE